MKLVYPPSRSTTLQSVEIYTWKLRFEAKAETRKLHNSKG